MSQRNQLAYRKEGTYNTKKDKVFKTITVGTGKMLTLSSYHFHFVVHLNITGKLRKLIDNKWQSIPVQERLKLTRLEGQVWIALFNLLMGNACQQKYEFNTYNKTQILKVKIMA